MTVQRRSQEQMPLGRLKELVSYNSETGIFTRLKSGGRKAAGSRAGYFNSAGYELISLDGHWYLGHRLAIYYATGVWPHDEVDHINGNPSDNRLANLRHATRSENMQNIRHGGGWHLHKTYKKWQALIRANGKRHFLGRFNTQDEARQAYEKAAANLHPFIERPAPAKQEVML
jgi:hypothetical protein